jgi:hypothetical protein
MGPARHLEIPGLKNFAAGAGHPPDSWLGLGFLVLVTTSVSPTPRCQNRDEQNVLIPTSFIDHPPSTPAK